MSSPRVQPLGGSSSRRGSSARPNLSLHTAVPEIDPDLTASLLTPKSSHPHRHRRGHHRHHHHHHHHHQPKEQQQQQQQQPEQQQEQLEQPPRKVASYAQEHEQPRHELLQVPQERRTHSPESDAASSVSVISGASTPSPAARAAMDHTGAWQPVLDRRQSWDRQEYKHAMLAKQRFLSRRESEGEGPTTGFSEV